MELLPDIPSSLPGIPALLPGIPPALPGIPPALPGIPPGPEEEPPDCPPPEEEPPEELDPEVEGAVGVLAGQAVSSRLQTTAVIIIRNGSDSRLFLDGRGLAGCLDSEGIAHHHVLCSYRFARLEARSPQGSA